MSTDPTTVVSPPTAELHARFSDLAALAGLSLAEIADEIGVTPNALYRIRSGHGGKRASWSTPTLNAISRTLAKRLGASPVDVYAYLTGLEGGKWTPTSESSSARGRRNAPAR